MKFIFTLLIIAIITVGFGMSGYEKEVRAAGDVGKDKIVELLVGILDAVKSLQVDLDSPQENIPNMTFGGFADRGCSFTEVASSTVGSTTPTQLLATSSRRAWAEVQRDLADISTSTVYLSFDGALGGNRRNHSLNSSSTELAFGLNTELPYTGSVYAVTSVGSTSVLVTESVYP